MADGPILKLVQPTDAAVEAPRCDQRASPGCKRSATRARRILSVGGGKGGIGKSLISANLGIALARRGQRVVLVDADLGGANLHTTLGLELPRRTLSDFIERQGGAARGRGHARPASRTSAWSPARSTTSRPPRPSTPRRCGCCATSRRMDVDYAILDLGAGTHTNVLDFFLVSDHGVLVLVPEPTAVENAYRFVKAAFWRRMRNVAQVFGYEPLLRDGHGGRQLPQPGRPGRHGGGARPGGRRQPGPPAGRLPAAAGGEPGPHPAGRRDRARRGGGLAEVLRAGDGLPRRPSTTTTRCGGRCGVRQAAAGGSPGRAGRPAPSSASPTGCSRPTSPGGSRTRREAALATRRSTRSSRSRWRPRPRRSREPATGPPPPTARARWSPTRSPPPRSRRCCRAGSRRPGRSLLDPSARARYDERIGVRPHATPLPPRRPLPCRPRCRPLPPPEARPEPVASSPAWPPPRSTRRPPSRSTSPRGCRSSSRYAARRRAGAQPEPPPRPAAPGAPAPPPRRRRRPAPPGARCRRSPPPGRSRPAGRRGRPAPGRPAPDAAPPARPPLRRRRCPVRRRAPAEPARRRAHRVTRAVAPILLDREVPPPRPLLVPEGAAWSGRDAPPGPRGARAHAPAGGGADQGHPPPPREHRGRPVQGAAGRRLPARHHHVPGPRAAARRPEGGPLLPRAAWRPAGDADAKRWAPSGSAPRWTVR